MIERSSIEIAQGQMREIKIADVPQRCVRRITIECLTEKCELEAKTMAIGGPYVAGVVPPFGLEIGMAEVIARKFIAIAGQGQAKFLTGGWQEQEQEQEQEQAC